MSDEELSRGNKVILKKVESLEESTTDNLWELETIQDLYSSSNTLSKTLSTLKNDKKLLEADSGKRGQNLWKLSDKGKRKLRKIVQRENKNLEDSDIEIYDKSNAKDVFIQYFEDEGKEEQQNVAAGQDTAELDFKKLEKHDPELADDLLENPEEVIDAAEKALEEFPHTSGNIEIRVSNIPEIEVKEISQLSPQKDRNKLITLEGVLEATTEPKGELTKGYFECSSCGSLYEKEQDSAKPKSPYKCECGSKKFSVVDLEYKTIVMGRIKDKPGKKSRKTLPVKISGDLAEDRSRTLNATGQGIRVTGYIELYKAKRGDDFLNVRMIANNLEIEDDKWSDVEIKKEDRDKIEEFRSGKTFDEIREDLVSSLAADRIAGMDMMKEAVLDWFLGRDGDSNLHCLVIGEPGLGKSDLMGYISENFPRTLKSVGTGSTGVGITATVRKDELTGDFVAEAGAVPQAHQGFHILDEADKAKEDDLSKLNEALSDKAITLSKANIHAEIPADVSEFAMGNPKNSVFDPYEPVYKQIPLSKEDLLERFDLKLALKREDLQKDRDQQEEILDKILSRGDTVKASDDEDLLSEDMLIKYIALAQEIKPEFTEEVVKQMKQIYFDLTDVDSDPEQEQKTLFGARRFSTLKKLSIAYARMDLSEKVKMKHLNRAASFLRECYETMDFEIGKDSFDDVSSREATLSSKIGKFLDENVPGDEPIEIEDLLDDAEEQLNYSREEIEGVIDTKKRDGELYQPEQGRIQHI